MSLTRWRPPDPVAVPPELTEALGSPWLAELLARRGLADPAAALAFLDGPALDLDALELPGAAAAVARLAAAIAAGERICVYGDYDADGVTATALLVTALGRLGASVQWYVPNRLHEGYGMNAASLEALAAAGVRLVLTCDCGVRNVAEVALASRLGLEVVVTDHHELGPELPAATAVVNPKLLADTDHPFYMISGAGVAYLVMRRLAAALGAGEIDDLLDLVAVGAIADVVPLQGANRLLVRRGLAQLWGAPRPGLAALLAVAGVALPGTEEDVAFGLVPCLNSAGRLGDAGLAVRLLLSEDPAAAGALAEQTDALNRQRRVLTDNVLAAALADIGATGGPGPCLVLYRPEWHEGVLGIVAGQLVERYGVPALLLARRQVQQHVVGSARAPAGFALLPALTACAEHLLRFGGHAAAAGFSLREERVPALRAQMLEQARLAPPPPAAGERQADLALPLDAVDRPLLDALQRACPFGEGNPAPVLYSAGAHLLSVRPIGAGGKHLRLVVRGEASAFAAVWWRAGERQVEPGLTDLVYRVGLNRWQGEERLQLVVRELATPAAVAPPAPGWEAVDRRGVSPAAAAAEFPAAQLFGEGPRPVPPAARDRYRLAPGGALLLLTPPASPRLFEELLAQTGAQQVILAWGREAPPEEERFLPALLARLARLHAAAGSESLWVALADLAVATGELEPAVDAALRALAASELLAIEAEADGRLRLRRRRDGHGVAESPALAEMRTLLAEARACRRHLRRAPLPAVRSLFR